MEKKAEVKKSENQKNDLAKDLQNLNIENLVSKTAKTRSIWKTDFKVKFSDNEKTARRKIRTKQLNLSKSLLHAIITKQDSKVINECANALFSFYTSGLEVFTDYTNVSRNENPDKRLILDKAYDKMKEVLNK